MNSAKKFITFSSVLAVLGFILLMLFFTPCFDVTNANHTVGQINLFAVTFGSLIKTSEVTASNFGVQSTPGIVCAFIFIILAILLALAKNRFKLFGFLTFGFFTAAGILVLISRKMAYYASKNAIGTGLGTAGNITQTGWVYAIGSLLIIIGAFALFDVLASLSKPKQKEIY